MKAVIKEQLQEISDLQKENEELKQQVRQDAPPPSGER